MEFRGRVNKVGTREVVVESKGKIDIAARGEAGRLI